MKPNVKKLFPGRDLKQEWKINRGSKDLNPVTVLPHISVNSSRLLDFYNKWRFKRDTYSLPLVFNDPFFPSINELSFLIHLPSWAALEMQGEVDAYRKIPWRDHQETLTIKKRVRSFVDLNKDYDPMVDERNYTRLSDGLNESYLGELLSQFKSAAVRARFLMLFPDEEIPEHIGYDPKYILRVYIPILTHAESVFYFNDHGVKHLPTGHAFVINTGVKHAIQNHSKRALLHLVVSLDGQKDLMQ